MAKTPSPDDAVILHYSKLRWGRIGLALVLLLTVWGGVSVFYTVEADSEGVVLRFGEYYKTTLPGLHAKLPWPIDTVMVVPVQQIQTLEFGFGTIAAGQVTRYAAQTQEHETMARMLTGDLNFGSRGMDCPVPHQGRATLFVQDRRSQQ